ncbi:MAG TPA: creatininase family protein [Gemmatimonadales bacterium]|nr:creatininase family protein [Gemmatimonadales bacterium]
MTPPPPRPWLLEESTWAEVQDAAYRVAILPWGATEAHNRHLPYGTDTIESGAVAAEAARLAWSRGARAIVLPTVPFGVHTGQRDIPLCLNATPSTQLALLRDIAESVHRAGIGKLVIINGHGANDFKQMIRELQGELPLFICTLNWYAAVDPTSYFDVPGDHAGESETSVTMHLNPDLVRPLATAGPGRARRFKVAGLREGWVWAPRRWTEVTDDTGVGDPRAATAAKGAAYFAAVAARIGTFLSELAAADLDAFYE